MAGSRRVEFKNDLTTKEYIALMNDNIQDVTELRLWSLEKIKESKAKVARAYNRKLKPKEFQVGDLVLEAVLPLHYTTTHFGPHIEMWAKGTCADKKTVGESFPDRIITVAVEAVGLAFADS
jgi:hypothetical protein